ncbi:MAG TPA: hypothetical protein VK130_07620 [Steroidobacteraceae bacterium]|nr:hypothetical protein [Steroidobacteraceae bacterium]
MSNNQRFLKSYNAGGAIAANSIVKVGANDYDVLQGAAATDDLIGVTTETASIAAERVDVVHTGVADVKLGGTVARGKPVSSDASGFGIQAAPGAGINNRVVGVALISGVAGDIIPVLVAPSTLQG